MLKITIALRAYEIYCITDKSVVDSMIAQFALVIAGMVTIMMTVEVIHCPNL